MQLDKLQLDLRPRPNAQALDLGFELLRVQSKPVLLSWLGLWLPLSALCLLLTAWQPKLVWLWWLLLWWLRPLLERAPLYVLSRQVFGEDVSTAAALKAWPGQLRGGWFRLLTWWRPFMPGRGLYQPIWQLEGLRGKAAADRRQVIGRDTASAAYWFGVACAHFEMVIQFGFIAFIGFFLSDEDSINPLSMFFSTNASKEAWLALLSVAGSVLSGAIIGPIYTACTFTLYLNRRATLEAWDVEIMLRQLKRPAAASSAPSAGVAMPALLAMAVSALLLLGSAWPDSASAAPAKTAPAKAAPATTEPAPATNPAAKTCEPPVWLAERFQWSSKAHSSEQAEIREAVKAALDTDELRGYRCEYIWTLKKDANEKKKTAEKPDLKLPDFSLYATIMKVLLIVAAIFLVLWLAYRYRGHFPSFYREPPAQAATEIAGLDIRPESLPTDVVTAVRQLWQRGELRAALALLYRATLSRLVSDAGLALTRGATENDCLRVAQRAHAAQQLSAAGLAVATEVTELWLYAAFADRWPGNEQIESALADWQQAFIQREVPA
ncbi:hypothetical protein HPT27_15655 [Permianibacter sp. IMCC34836]|uniref:hypothetical protein n=1 Tax=Permianibacter fluminis TaxID=2738515 RepID=UPI00155679EA|nr:hypothetical protein [Permianibacter fluminis]NQD38457.1 hypothetical protein [Permianibacter fluminis]